MAQTFCATDFPAVPVFVGELHDACSVMQRAIESTQFAESDISAFSHNYRTPEIHQASLSLEREVAHRVVAEVSYSFVHGPKFDSRARREPSSPLQRAISHLRLFRFELARLRLGRDFCDVAIHLISNLSIHALHQPTRAPPPSTRID
jgi:hypothetical protein